MNEIFKSSVIRIHTKEFKTFLKKNNLKFIFTPFSKELNELLNQALVNNIKRKMNKREEKRRKRGQESHENV